MDIEAVLMWLKVVDADLDTARNCIDGPHFVPESGAYHCQQAAEKLVKAVLVANGIAPPRTHDIDTLVAALPADVAGGLDRLVDFTPYATAFRYPEQAIDDGISVPSRAELVDWIADIERIKAEVIATYLATDPS